MIKPTSKLAYSIAELASAAGVGRSFIYEEIKSGRLKLKKAGRRSLVMEEDARAWLAGMPELYVRATAKNRSASAL
jgi:excisionase family DNA binding protein